MLLQQAAVYTRAAAEQAGEVYKPAAAARPGEAYTRAGLNKREPAGEPEETYMPEVYKTDHNTQGVNKQEAPCIREPGYKRGVQAGNPGAAYNLRIRYISILLKQAPFR